MRLSDLLRKFASPSEEMRRGRPSLGATTQVLRGAPYQERLDKCQRFPGTSLGLGTCSFLRRGIAQQLLRPWVYLPGISAVGIPALVPFRDRIAGTHDRRFAGAGTDAAVGLGAGLHRDVGGARDRHPPRRIRARGSAARRGGTIDTRRLDRLAEAAPQLGMTYATPPFNTAERILALTIKGMDC